MMRYQLANIGDGFHKGWLKIKFLDRSERLVPQGLIVTSTDEADIYLLFEGVYKGQKAFIQKKYLTGFLEKFKKLELKIDTSKNKIYLNDLNFDIILNRLNDFSDEMLVLVPDYPHQKIPLDYTLEKVGGSRFAETWFKLIDNDGLFRSTEKYFHFGKYSNGCVTFPYTRQLQASPWNQIYEILIKNRTMNGVCATMIVI